MFGVLFFQAEDGIRDLVRSRGLGDVYKRQAFDGDMVAALVMGEIAHRNVEGWLGQPDNFEDPLYSPDPAHREHLLRPCNALSIAEACGLKGIRVHRARDIAAAIAQAPAADSSVVIDVLADPNAMPPVKAFEKLADY